MPLMRSAAKRPVEKVLLLLDKIICRAYTALLWPCFHSIGEGSRINPPFRFSNLGDVELGKNVVIQSHSWIEALENTQLMASPKLIVGDHAFIGMNATITAAKRIVIGEYVMMGRNVYISDHGHEFTDVTKPIACQGIRKVSDVSIGPETWLGQNAVILPGVSIGRHCIIGANSVVTRDLPDYCTAVGAPARIINKYNMRSLSWETCPKNE